MPETDTSARARRSSTPPWAVLLVLALSTFTVVVMQTMVMPIMAGQAESLGVSMADVSWVVTVNLLSAAVCTPFLGSLGDSPGRERVLVITLGFKGVGDILGEPLPHADARPYADLDDFYRRGLVQGSTCTSTASVDCCPPG